jgi:hypothetical protein
MKRLKAQIEEAKLPEQSFESTYITKKVKRWQKKLKIKKMT